MSDSCFLAMDDSAENVMKIEEDFPSDDFTQKESNPAKKRRLVIPDPSQNRRSGQEFTDDPIH